MLDAFAGKQEPEALVNLHPFHGVFNVILIGAGSDGEREAFCTQGSDCVCSAFNGGDALVFENLLFQLYKAGTDLGIIVKGNAVPFLNQIVQIAGGRTDTFFVTVVCKGKTVFRADLFPDAKVYRFCVDEYAVHIKDHTFYHRLLPWV